jgi:hypothetical protein
VESVTCAAYRSSRARKAAFKVVPRARAISLARRIKLSSALRVMFLMSDSVNSLSAVGSSGRAALKLAALFVRRAQGSRHAARPPNLYWHPILNANCTFRPNELAARDQEPG